MRELLRSSAGAVIVLLIMVLGSFGLWVGTPLLWLYIGGQVQGSTESLGSALAVMFVGSVLTIVLVAVVLARLSDTYRWIRVMRGRSDPGHVVLESVLVVSAGMTLVGFGIWFFLFAGASPIPIGIQL
jgi:hypothetical protein